MQIYNLFKTISARLRYSYDNKIVFPKVIINEDGKDILMSLFPLRYTGIDDVILPLSSMWNMLSYENQKEISDFICGVRLRQDFFTLMKWMNKRANIDNFILNVEIDTN